MPIGDYFEATTWRNPYFLRNAAMCFLIFGAIVAVAALCFHFSAKNGWAIIEAVLICVVGWMVCLELIPNHGSRLGMYTIMGRNAGELTAIAAGGSLLLYQILRSVIARRKRGFPVLTQTNDEGTGVK